jgi:hypothetical protein
MGCHEKNPGISPTKLTEKGPKARCRSKIPPVHRADVQVILGNLFSLDASSEIFTSRVLGEIKLATRHDGHRMEGFVALV